MYLSAGSTPIVDVLVERVRVLSATACASTNRW